MNTVICPASGKRAPYALADLGAYCPECKRYYRGVGAKIPAHKRQLPYQPKRIRRP